jgi:hypothetical protein
MKRAFKLFVAIFVISILSAGTTVIAEEKTKEYNETWSAGSVETLEITNKFGEIKVLNDGGSEITIDVTVTVEGSNEKKVNDLLEKIEVNFKKSGNTISAVTTIEKSFKSQRKFSIDYEVNIPSDKNLKISNKYGNTIVNTLNANGDFNIQYGNLKANELKAKDGGSMEVLLAYGNADIYSAANLDVNVKYSDITLGEINDLKIESKYSVIDIEEGGSIKIMSKYDKFNFEEVESVHATTKYSHLRIDELAKSLTVSAGYGGVKVGQISSDFESIDITNSYGQISLGLDDANYSIDASCEYCGISYPEDEFVGNKIKEKNTRTLKGKIGSGNGGTVKVKSRYGEIKL